MKRFDRPFAAHPKETRVAIGGIRGGRTVLQVWDYETGKLVLRAIASALGMFGVSMNP